MMTGWMRRGLCRGKAENRRWFWFSNSSALSLDSGTSTSLCSMACRCSVLYLTVCGSPRASRDVHRRLDADSGWRYPVARCSSTFCPCATQLGPVTTLVLTVRAPATEKRRVGSSLYWSLRAT